MKQPRDFPSLEAFILHLSQKPSVVGILQYGRRDFRDMGPGGDFDLNVILADKPAFSPAGLHFHIAGIPVDCGILPLADLREKRPPSDYHCVLLKSELLYDASGEIADLLESITEHWQLEVPAMQEGELAFERFIRQHILDKFRHRAFEDEVYTRVFLSGNLFYLLENYMRIHALSPYAFKDALDHMRQNAPESYRLFQAFLATHDLHEQLTLTRELNEAILQKIGGPWRRDEVIFHYNDFDQKHSIQDKQEVMALIFGE